MAAIFPLANTAAHRMVRGNMATTPPPPTPRRVSRLVVALALVPVLALTLGIPFANRLEPRVFGLPFLLAWIVAWILLTPVFMSIVHRLDRRGR